MKKERKKIEEIVLVTWTQAKRERQPKTFKTKSWYANIQASTCWTSNDIIAGNGRVLKVYMFIVWLYLFKKIKMLIYFFLLMHYIATFDGGCLQNCHYREMAWLPFQKRDQGKYLVLIITWTLKKLFVMFLC